MMAAIPSLEDRLEMRSRPAGMPVMHQNWENLLFLHWPVEPAVLRPLVPPELELDLFGEKAWISVTPFAMSGVRLHPLPQVPGLDAFLELNVRTYVHHAGRPGIYFFSLDASKAVPTLAARVFYFLPYFRAQMEFSETSSGRFQFASHRLAASAHFSARWRVGDHLPAPDAASLPFFLVERYALFTKAAGRIFMVRIHHHPWILEEAQVQTHQSTMIAAQGIAEPAQPPLAHFSKFLAVEAWEPQPVA